MKKLYLVWILVCIVLALISMRYKGESTTFYGIADAREIVINHGNPVEIEKIYVVQGQSIQEGDTLVTLKRPDLDMKIHEITQQISQTKTQAHAKLNNIRSQIQELEAQYERNIKLTAELKSFKNESVSSDRETGRNPLLIKIENLKKELRFYSSSTRIQEELNLLLAEKKNLVIFAQINGVIGSVDARDGEKVSPFTPIITVHTKSPSYIQGYIHENVYNKISVGQKVSVAPLSDPGNTIRGDVVGVGSRIVEYPERLRKRPDFRIWGREVVIRIPAGNDLLLGEKVLISYAGL